MADGKRSEMEEKRAGCEGASATERLLDAWLRATIAIRNQRFVKELTYNESIICKLLSDDAAEGGEGLTATELCAAMQMKKSQMNRTLNDMESHGLIERSLAKEDHRKQLIKLRESQMCCFKQQHARILEFVDSIMGELGAERSCELTAILNELADAASRVDNALAAQR